MFGINQVTLIGHLGSDMEQKNLNGRDGKVANLSVATDASYKDREKGEWVNRADWHRIVTYQTGLIDYLAGKATKGKPVLVQGQLKTRSYEDSSGNTKWTTEVLVGSRGTIQLLEKVQQSENMPVDDAGDVPDEPADDDIAS